MNARQAAKLAVATDKGRKDLIEYLRTVDRTRLQGAADEVNLPRFPYKLREYPGDLTTAMLVKITNSLKG